MNIFRILRNGFPKVLFFTLICYLANVFLLIGYKTLIAMIVVLFIVSQFVALGCVSAYGLHLEREEQRNYRNNLMAERQGKKRNNSLL